MMRLHFGGVLLAACALSLLAGCASAPRPQGPALDAYAATPAGHDLYRIQYRGDAAAPQERILDFGLAYASQLAAREGARYFAVIDETKSGEGEIYYFADDVALSKKADPKTLLVQIFPHRPKRVLVFRAGDAAEVVYEKYGLNRRPEAM